MFDLRANDPEAREAISKAVGVVLTPVDICFSRWREGELMGGVIYNRFTHSSIMMHAAGFAPNWLNRDFLWLVFHYPFEQLRLERVFAFVHSKNAEALAFDTKLGFVVETRIRKVYPDGDQIILVMERDQCRWLKIKPKYMQANRGN